MYFFKGPDISMIYLVRGKT